MMIQLSKRLSAVARLVTMTGVLADVGTDHGYIPVALVKERRLERAVAMDVNAGPLERARQHIRQYGLEDRIDTRLSDGLQALEPGEADSIVIAGMGGALMKRILTEGQRTARTAGELILQPQSEVMEFRRFLWENHYDITAEDMVYEDGKYYPMMRAVPGVSGKEEPDRLSLKYGQLLLEQKHPVLCQYLQKQRQQKLQILENMQKNAKQDIRQRTLELEQELEDIGSALQIINGAEGI